MQECGLVALRLAGALLLLCCQHASTHMQVCLSARFQVEHWGLHTQCIWAWGAKCCQHRDWTRTAAIVASQGGLGCLWDCISFPALT